MIEVEVKLKVSDLNKVRETLISEGFEKEAYINERDTYFDNDEEFIVKNGYALRVRRTLDLDSQDEFSKVTFKGKLLDSVSKTRQELETKVSDGNTMEEIVKMLGYHPVSPIVEKNREMIAKDGITACLDEVKNLGSFLELEIIVEEESGRETALDRIKSLLAMLGYGMEDTITRSYLGLLKGEGK